jgi:hypothetical protein
MDVIHESVDCGRGQAYNLEADAHSFGFVGGSFER